METEQNNDNPPINSRDNKKIIVIVGSIVGVIVLLGGFFLVTRNSQTSSPTPSILANEVETQNLPASTPNESEEIANSQIISVEGGNYYYKPNEIKVKTGEKVTIEFNSMGSVHDFIIDELKVKSPVVQAGQKTIVEFTPTKVGEYKFYCSVGNHRAMGMEGTLIVE